MVSEEKKLLFQQIRNRKLNLREKYKKVCSAKNIESQRIYFKYMENIPVWGEKDEFL